MSSWPILAGLVLRLLVFSQFPTLPEILDASVECSTPVTSFKRLQEGVFQYVHSASPYIGGVCHQSPLLLALFSILPTKSNNIWVVNSLYSMMDILIGWLLSKIAEEFAKGQNEKISIEEFTANEKENSSDRKSSFSDKNKESSEENSSSDKKTSPSSLFTSFTPNIVAAAYLFNPLILLSTFSRSTVIFTNATIAGAVHAAVTKRPTRAVVLLALASTLSLYPVYLAPALILLAMQSINNNGSKTISFTLLSFIFIIATGLFFAMSYIPTGSWDFVGSTYGVMLLFKDLTPNIGLWWYFFTEMFDFFRPFFIGVFQIYVAGFSIPVTIRFHSQPLFAIITLVGIITVFKAYPEVGDVGFYFALLTLYKPIFSLLSYQLITGLALLYCSVLAPTFYHLWVYLGSGNSNFFYAITLVHALGMTLMLSDTIWAALRIDYDGGKNPSVCQI